ncbi:hypothetical protein CAPTEDRAFT_189055 [Capitella teleta]|uniref:Uncharacterized protein n=1 Tax=Capitella teleta TaxID=283909 RepID=R7UN92_CAPTE|nr:hypothetical protein CAPTEDRAFT_189055 [Capitella teleta]|eukprot:ELU07685.1 hypothetical protein CAPTEDRAFT_189055 [Capitella teleta]
MASNRQYRPHVDWTPDIKLPQRFATWKSEIQDEVLLFEGEDKPPKYIYNYGKDDDEEETEDVDFNTLSTTHDPKAPHLRPIWSSDPHISSVHFVSRLGSWVQHLSSILISHYISAAPMDPPSVTIGDQPVENLGSKVMSLRVENMTLNRHFQIYVQKTIQILNFNINDNKITITPVFNPVFTCGVQRGLATGAGRCCPVLAMLT